MTPLNYEHQDVQQMADDNNCELVYPEHNQIQIDIDSEEAWQTHKELLELYESRFDYIRKCVVTPSKSGLPHRHVTITLNNTVDAVERIALQAALGSDRKRELISLSRLEQGEQRVTRFFEPKQPKEIQQ